MTIANKIIIGLTGSFGVGKSRVGQLFKELGACVIDADKLAHEALEPGNPNFEKIVLLFGNEIVINGKLDRKKIAEIIFRDAAKRKALETIIHPYVFRRIEEEAGRAKEKVILVEVPLLFETGFDSKCDHTIVVFSDEEVTEKRLGEKGFSPAEIKARNRAQMLQQEKLKLTQMKIDNSKSIEETKNQVHKIWSKINAG